MSIDKSKVDAEAEAEGDAVSNQRAMGNMRVQGGRRRAKSVHDLQEERAHKKYILQQERPRNSFRATGI